MWAGPGSIDTAIFPERLLSGFQPTKSFHLGHWSGAIQPCHRFQNLYPGQCYLVVADLHAMTGRNSGESMRATTQAAACSLLALGIDPDRCVIYRQSDAPQVCELMWILACSLGKGHLDRSHAYKAAVNRGTPVSVGLFLYPLLQVADILAMRSTRVPAGPDQRQSVELARDVARRVNYLSNTLVLPEPTLASSGDSIALSGTDGIHKMSVQYDNYVSIFEDEMVISNQINSITSPATPIGVGVDPKIVPAFRLLKVICSDDQVEHVRSALKAGSLGMAELKEVLLSNFLNRFAEPRERYREIAFDYNLVNEILADGAARARKEAVDTITVVKEVMKL